MSNAIAISRDLVASGLTQKQADTIAEVVVTHADESHATKADVARLEGRLDRIEAENKASFRFVYWALGVILALQLLTLAS